VIRRPFGNGFHALLLGVVLFAFGDGNAAEPTWAERAAEARRSMIAEADAPETSPLRRARLLLATGSDDQALRELDRLDAGVEEGDGDVELLRSTIHMRRYEFADAESALSRVKAAGAISEPAFLIRIDLLELREDLARIDTLVAVRAKQHPNSVAALLGQASLDYQLHRIDEAERGFEEALAAASRPEEMVRALTGLLRITIRRGASDDAEELALRAFEAGIPTPALLNEITWMLIRRGEVREGIDLTAEALRWDRWNERAHYLLGNGYARRNYTELEEAYPEAFPGPADAERIAEARSRIAAGDRAGAREKLRALTAANPNLVEPDLLFGSLHWEEGQADSAIARFAAVIDRATEHGRAHNGIAKSMEMKRLRVSVHREKCERAFAATPMPAIEGMDRFIVNWESLSDRHRKSVALSVLPWAKFLPVLIETGSTFYIKPLYEHLSESPHQDVLRDQRISYDSRLWDDVRGCGGYNPVTGIEDVERTIFDKYNTVLHELTHQVHYVLTPDEKRAIRETYRNAKAREGEGRNTFLSRYQGSSVEEYFAEGMNSYATPRSDAYDTREVVRERLDILDPDLVRLIEMIATDTTTSRYYVPAYVLAAYHRLEKGKTDEALVLIEKAIARSPDDEEALCALSFTENVLGRHDAAAEAAVRATKKHGEAAEPWLASARAIFHRTGSRSEQIATLLRAREAVDQDERYLVELALGEAYAGRGDLEKAEEAYARVLGDQEDHPVALWGLAAAHGLAAEADAADTLFRLAIRRRSGIVELRAEYARFLTRQRRFDEAEKQLEEARLLDPRNSDTEAAAGLLAIYRSDWDEARDRLGNAVVFAPHNDLATILLAHAFVAGGDYDRAEELLVPVLDAVDRGAPPSYLFLEKKGEYREIHQYGAEERWLLYRTASELADARGDTAAAREFRRRMDRSFR